MTDFDQKRDRKQDQKRDNVLRKMLNTPPDPRISKKDNPKVKKPAKYAALQYLDSKLIKCPLYNPKADLQVILT